MTELGKSLKNEGREEGIREIAKNLLDILSVEMIAKKTGLTIEEVCKLKEEVEKKQ